MARDRKPAPKPTALTASAANFTAARIDYNKHARTARGWQERAWYFYDTIGEYRYACDWIGSMLAKALLFAARETPDGPEALHDHAAAQALSELFNGPEGQAEMLRQMGIHFTVAGECYLFGWSEGDQDKWMIAASTAVTQRQVQDDKYIWLVNNEAVGSETQEVLGIRLWKPHPQRPLEANSPSRAVLGILSEIESLSLHVQAQVVSRLAGSGIFFVPSEITLPAKPQSDTDETPAVAPNTATEFMQILQKAMMAAIHDRGDASAITPIVVTAPGDHIDKAKHVTFWSELDEHAIELRNEAIRRLSLGLDMPPEMLTGVAGDNHWNAWLADESGIKAHTEPLLKVLTSALSEGFLRPALRGLDGYDADGDPVSALSVRADTSQMRLRPNRSREALELYDRAELSGEALRRETGFGTDDALTGEAITAWYLRHVAKGQTTPELVAEALRALGLAFTPEPPPDVQHEARPDRSLDDHPDRNPPEVPAALLPTGLVEAANQIVLRALERAGNRIRNRTQVHAPGVSAMNTYMAVRVRAGDMDFLLDDAWTHVPDVAHRYGVEEGWLTAALDSYCRLRMKDQRRHDFEEFSSYLTNLLALARDPA